MRVQPPAVLPHLYPLERRPVRPDRSTGGVAMTAVANPYANLQLRIPGHEWEAVRRFTNNFRPDDGSAPNIDQSPFNRYVDLWWAALIIGVREGRRSKPTEWHDFTP